MKLTCAQQSMIDRHLAKVNDRLESSEHRDRQQDRDVPGDHLKTEATIDACKTDWQISDAALGDAAADALY